MTHHIAMAQCEIKNTKHASAERAKAFEGQLAKQTINQEFSSRRQSFMDGSITISWLKDLSVVHVHWLVARMAILRGRCQTHSAHYTNYRLLRIPCGLQQNYLQWRPMSSTGPSSSTRLPPSPKCRRVLQAIPLYDL